LVIQSGFDFLFALLSTPLVKVLELSMPFFHSGLFAACWIIKWRPAALKKPLIDY